MTILAISVLTLLVICFVIAKRKSASENLGALGFNGGNIFKSSTRKSIAPRNPWRATSIVHDEKACDAVKAIGGKRFLDVERNIPKIPLPTCDTTRCNCKYDRHEDRRDSSEDRRMPNALHAELYDRTGKGNRRNRKRGRRKTDWA